MGPLAGVRVIELGGIGPCPFCGMLLADMGADVVRVERLGTAGGGRDDAPPFEIAGRGKRPIALDLKRPEAVGLMLDLVATA
ncbi:MAG: CoA transferase, partial [Alphaproteobacteria bacterium]